MKEKRTKKESNKEEAKKETEVDSVLALEKTENSPLRKEIKINWEAFIRFFNATLQLHGSQPSTMIPTARQALVGVMRVQPL